MILVDLIEGFRCRCSGTPKARLVDKPQGSRWRAGLCASRSNPGSAIAYRFARKLDVAVRDDPRTAGTGARW
ncbi:hypothetical protein M8494_17195 [Serratia ureilytica]